MIQTSLVLVLIAHLGNVNGHGRLIEPPSRASAWRYGFDTPHNYNDHELFCGGFTRQWQANGGKCGVCGDAWDSKLPRAHEYGGTYGQGVIVRQYNVGSAINLRVELTASHMGYFTFSVCPDYKNASQECLDKHILKTLRPQDGLAMSDIRFYPRDGSRVYEMKYRLPKLSCSHCLLQWRYIAGNNWGACPNGTEQVGCGPQEEFRACADITIGKGFVEQPETTTIEPEVVVTSTALPPSSDESYSPLSAILISIVSFLVVFLIFFLLYFHYYRVGGKIKSWIKQRGENKTEESGAPMPPPRNRRSKSRSDSQSDLQEINLKY
ncbi:hypothetical protein PPYR_02841 [Photinus pyralis]|uniref:Chitin-binding type-4 domain-containing protein n=3 Tax=Photinus pyralis TaxID=7054 RepID=A0A5N4A175_PHOPY|nr:uncharacterized protein LOC116162548 [Photinus pyralis]XP_031332044.1 uncharacterized protein LOC116162548 [Photinus pyralis]KAB0791041.1 hypothetical protein PPYR_02841 [Photinus pyralis]